MVVSGMVASREWKVLKVNYRIKADKSEQRLQYMFLSLNLQLFFLYKTFIFITLPSWQLFTVHIKNDNFHYWVRFVSLQIIAARWYFYHSPHRP